MTHSDSIMAESFEPDYGIRAVIHNGVCAVRRVKDTNSEMEAPIHIIAYSSGELTMSILGETHTYTTRIRYCPWCGYKAKI